MSSAAVRRVTDFVRRAAGATTVDADLLGRIAIDRDEAAFAVIVRRHGSAVRAACRRVLGPTPDADDAFQATFVVLWREAARVRKTGSVGAWLYGAAHRISCQARIAAARRRRLEQNAAASTPVQADSPDPSWREASGVLHEELDRLPDRYRLPLVLCYLESKSRDEAAAQLGWSVGSVKGRLERGRDRLRWRLMRRGIDLSAGLLAVLAGETNSAAGLPTTLVRATVEAAGGVPSAAVAALVRGAGVVTHAKLAVVAVVLGLAVAGGGIGLLVPAVATPAEAPVAAAGIPAPPVEPALEVTFQGRVLDPGGKPVAGARLFSYQKPAGAAPSNSQLDLAQRAVTDTGGQFRFTAPRILLERPGNQTDLLPVLAVADGFGIAWALLPKPDEDLTFRLAPDQPIVGRILDTEGRPVADCTVEVREVIRYRLGRLDGFLAGWRADWRDAMYADMEAGLDHPPASMMPVTGPDRDGRFRISGVGAERQVILDVKAPGLAQGVLFVMTRPDFDPGPTNRAVLERSLHLPGPLPVLYGPTLNYVATPAKPIVGRVREAVSGRPIAGANVGAGIAYSSGVSATTDSGGRFHLDGMPKQKDYSLFVRPPSGSPLIGRLIRFVDTEGLQPLTADVELVRGSIISGRIIDRSNGRGVSSNIHFYSLPDESVAGKTGIGRDRQSDFGTTTGPDGRFRLPVVAGPGVLTVRADGREVLDTQTIDPFLPALLDAQERKRARVTIHGDTSYFVTTADGAMRPITANIVKLLNPSAGAESEPMELFVERGRTVAVRIEDPDGRPLTGTIVSGMTAMWPITFTLPSAECTLYALDPRKPRMVVFYHPERKLVGVLRARGDEAAPLTVRLLPTGGTVTGRVLDSAGEPVAGAGVMQHYSEDESARELFRYLSARGRRGVRTQTGADGSFRFDEVLPDLRFDLGFKKGATTLAGPAGNLWFGPHRVAGGKALDLGDLRTKPRGE